MVSFFSQKCGGLAVFLAHQPENRPAKQAGSGSDAVEIKRFLFGMMIATKRSIAHPHRKEEEYEMKAAIVNGFQQKLEAASKPAASATPICTPPRETGR